MVKTRKSKLPEGTFIIRPQITEEQGLIGEGIELQNDILQEQLSQYKRMNGIMIENMRLCLLNKKKLTEEYPHICFECGKKLYFNELLVRNRKLYTREQLEKLWKCKHVYFYCCSCFRKKEIEEKQAAKNKRLIKKAKRICEKFGFNLS